MLKQFLIACVVGLGLAAGAHAASVRPMLLDEIIDTAAIAFQGTCTGNRSERDAQTNFIVTYTTFEVRDVIKGNALATHVIKQIGGSLAGSGETFQVKGVPKFAVGEEYVVFLAGVSSAGFSSPIGLGQGQFQVLQKGASKVVTSGRDLSELTARMPGSNMSAAEIESGELGLERFKQMARKHANNLK